MQHSNNLLDKKCFRVIIRLLRLRWRLQWISISTKILFKKLEEKRFSRQQAAIFRSKTYFNRKIKWTLRWELVIRQLSRTFLRSRSKSLTKSTISVFLSSKLIFQTVSFKVSSISLKKKSKRIKLANSLKCLLDQA
jgi:hypothetical protein